METTQTNLLRAVRDLGNDEAWSRFYRIYATMISHFVRRLGLPDADAEDVTQEVLVIAHKSLAGGVYDPAKGRFRHWLYGIARKRAMVASRARHRRTRAQLKLPEGGDLLDQLADDQADQRARELWEQEWRYALLDEGLRHAQETVGEKVFEAFSLYVRERLPVQNVAERLGISPSSVYVYKHRVVIAVREWVEQFDDESARGSP